MSQLAITLSEENWRAIQSLIQEGCQIRGGQWTKWGKQIIDHIDASVTSQIQAAFDEGNAEQTNFDWVIPQTAVNEPERNYSKIVCPNPILSGIPVEYLNKNRIDW